MLTPVPDPPTIRREFYSVPEVAYILAVSQKTVRDLIKQGELTSIKVGAHHRISVDDLHRWLTQKSRE